MCGVGLCVVCVSVCLLFQQEELEKPEKEREMDSSTNTPEKSSFLSTLAKAYKMTNLKCSYQSKYYMSTDYMDVRVGP